MTTNAVLAYAIIAACVLVVVSLLIRARRLRRKSLRQDNRIYVNSEKDVGASRPL